MLECNVLRVGDCRVEGVSTVSELAGGVQESEGSCCPTPWSGSAESEREGCRLGGTRSRKLPEERAWTGLSDSGWHRGCRSGREGQGVRCEAFRGEVEDV